MLFRSILVDSTDPVGPAAGLFEEDFYRLAQVALKEDGILIAQSDSPFYQESCKGRCTPTCAQSFP